MIEEIHIDENFSDLSFEDVGDVYEDFSRDFTKKLNLARCNGYQVIFFNNSIYKKKFIQHKNFSIFIYFSQISKLIQTILFLKVHLLNVNSFVVEKLLFKHI